LSSHFLGSLFCFRCFILSFFLLSALSRPWFFETVGPLNIWPSIPFGLWPILLYYTCIKTIIVIFIIHGYLLIILIFILIRYPLIYIIFFLFSSPFLFSASSLFKRFRSYSSSYLFAIFSSIIFLGLRPISVASKKSKIGLTTFSILNSLFFNLSSFIFGHSIIFRVRLLYSTLFYFVYFLYLKRRYFIFYFIVLYY